VSYFVNYCTECDWSASTPAYTRSEQSGLAIAHHIATGHDIAGERRATEPSGTGQETGWATEWPPPSEDS